MDISKLSDPLNINQIDFRIQNINKGGYATILAYKDARTDQQRLDDVVGPLGWKREHVNNNHNCIVSIWCDQKKEWVSKEDTGTESYTEQQKGLASDSFKRACFNWGIGRELYDYPDMSSIKLHDNEWELYKDKTGKERARATWNLRLKEWIWFSQFKDGEISYLAAKDSKGLRFSWGIFDKQQKHQETKQSSSGDESPSGKVMRHNIALSKNFETVTAVKQAIYESDLSSAAEAWYEMTQEDQIAIGSLAPSKGGVLTTEEIAILKTTEFRESHYKDTKT